MKTSFLKNPIATAVQTAFFGFALVSVAFADVSEPVADLGNLSVSFEKSNLYVSPKSSAATGLLLSNKETPQMVSVVSQARIQDQNLQTIEDVLKNTPALDVGNIDGGRVKFSSRGFDIGKFAIDGMNMDFNQQMSVGEYHLPTAIYDRVEVTHGSTGLVSGSGDPSARVHLLKKKAVYTVPTLTATLTADRFGSYGASADYASAITDDGSVRGRAVAFYKDGNTFIDRQKFGQQVVYGTVSADLSDKTEATVSATYINNDRHSFMWGGLPRYWSDGKKADWSVDKNSSVDWARWGSKNQEYFAGIDHAFDDNWSVSLKVSHMDLKGSPKLLYHAYNVVDVATNQGVVAPDRNPYSLYTADNTRKQNHVQADVAGKFELFEKPSKINIGASYNTSELTASSANGLDSMQKRDFVAWDGSYPEPTWGTKELKAKVDTKEQAIYGVAQIKINEPLSVVGGLRLSNYDKQGIQWGRAVSSRAKNVLTPYAGAVFDINDHTALYASYTSIFRPQSERDVAGNFLKPVDGATYEIGLKGSSADDRLQAQVSMFSTQQKNLAQADGDKKVAGTVTKDNAKGEQAYYGVEGATSKGMSIELTGKLTPNLQSGIGLTRFDSKDNKGNQINTTYADRLVKVFAIYEVPFVDGLSVGGGVNWSGERYAMAENPATKIKEKYSQSPVTLVDLMARYRVGKNTDVQLNLSNALNQKYISGSGFSQITYGEPLNVSGSLTYRF